MNRVAWVARNAYRPERVRRRGPLERARSADPSWLEWPIYGYYGTKSRCIYTTSLGCAIVILGPADAAAYISRRALFAPD